MDVFVKYFRRLVLGHSSQIFPGVTRVTENPSNYGVLVQEMEKITKEYEPKMDEPTQAWKIAETIDASEGDLFRDFDLSTFMEHFKLDALAKTLLASAFTHVTRSDLRMKGRFSCFPSFRLLIPPRWGYTCQHSRRSYFDSCKRSQ